VRKTTNVGDSHQSPTGPSWGGNFATYIQHKVDGACGPNGTLTGAIRAQLETTQGQHGTKINDASAAYFGIYNNGRDVGGFGLHVDAYHVGAEEHGHSTYGMSAECWKVAPGGVMASYVARAQQGRVDYGFTLLHSSGTFNRGIQFGNPSYGMGGVQGAPGTPTEFNVGIDMTHGLFRSAPIMVKAGDSVVLSGAPQSQDAVIVDSCHMRFDPMTGMFAVANGEHQMFFVNMSNGVIWQNGAPTWAANSNAVPWAFAVGAGKTEPVRPSATPDKFLRVSVDGEDFLISLYRQ
jgi:hypothetical protein